WVVCVVRDVMVQDGVQRYAHLMRAFPRIFRMAPAFAALAALLSLTLPGRDAAAADSGQAAPHGPSEDARAGSDTGEPMRDRV
ncbi:MAG: MFS transporter, partial [Thermobispora sp.]|nr:MFS transporter [Thermobispora sp.]